MNEFRIGNIALRYNKIYCEIVAYHPNGYYGRENDFIYDDIKKMYCHKDYDFCYVNSECFKHKESCYTIAEIIFHDDEEHDIKSVGSRPYNLSDEDFLSYVEIIKFTYENKHLLKNEAD